MISFALWKNSKEFWIVLIISGPGYALWDSGLFINNVTKEDEGDYLCRAFQVTSQSSTLRDQQITASVHCKLYLYNCQLLSFKIVLLQPLSEILILLLNSVLNTTGANQ